MTTDKIITFRRFDKCPVSGKTRETHGHSPVTYSDVTRAHHLPPFAINISTVILERLDEGRTVGSYEDECGITVWEVEG
jgi:hypothetical protein